MKNTIALLLLVVSMVSNSYAQDDYATLTNLKKVLWPKAYREQDQKLLDTILSDQFQMIDQNGVWTSKKDELEYISKNKPTYDAFNYDIKRLEIFDDHTAVISGIGTITHLDESGKKRITTYHSSNVLIKTNDQWKAITSHVSGVKQVD